MKGSTLLDKFKKEIKFYKAVLKDPRTPKISKFFLGLAVAYAINPIDLIPDFIPVVGHLDDAIIIPVLIFIAVKGKVGIIHWNYDPSTPRGSSMDIRPKPEDCIRWAEQAGYGKLRRFDLKPYHYGIVMTKKGEEK